MDKQAIKKFIVDTLLPYKLDPDICGHDINEGCVYLTSDNRKCAVGKHMVKGEWQHASINSMDGAGFIGNSVGSIFERWGWEKVLTKEAQKFHIALGDKALRVWSDMQGYHDAIAIGEFRSSYASSIESLLEIKLTELKQ